MRRGTNQGFASHLFLCSLFALGSCGSVGIGVVWMRHQISVQANANKALQSQLAVLDRRIQADSAAIAAGQDPAVLARLNVAWNLGLVPPKHDQVLRVTEDPVVRLAAKHNRGLFGESLAGGFKVAQQP